MNNISRRNFALLELSQCIKPSAGLLHYVVAVHCCIMYKVKYGMAPRRESELFTIKSTHQHLRNCDFELSCFDTVAYGRHLLHYQGPFVWSKVSIVSSET